MEEMVAQMPIMLLLITLWSKNYEPSVKMMKIIISSYLRYIIIPIDVDTQDLDILSLLPPGTLLGSLLAVSDINDPVNNTIIYAPNDPEGHQLVFDRIVEDNLLIYEDRVSREFVGEYEVDGD